VEGEGSACLRLLIDFFFSSGIIVKPSACPLLIVPFKVPPPQGKISSAQAANATTTSTLVVQTLQASAEFAVEAHNGVGWVSSFVSGGTNAFCALSYSQYWSQVVQSQTGCMVLYNPAQVRLFSLERATDSASDGCD
jgi:hypothetical protein